MTWFFGIALELGTRSITANLRHIASVVHHLSSTKVKRIISCKICEVFGEKFGNGQKVGHHCWRKNKNTMLEGRGSVNRWNCNKIRLPSGCSAEAVRGFEETAAYDAPLSIKKRLVGIRKITLAMKSRLKQEVLRKECQGAQKGGAWLGQPFWSAWSSMSCRSSWGCCPGLPPRSPCWPRRWSRSAWSSTSSTSPSAMFSDESTFRILNSRGGTMRRPSTMYRYRRKYRVIMVKHCWTWRLS